MHVPSIVLVGMLAARSCAFRVLYTAQTWRGRAVAYGEEPTGMD